MKVFTSLALLSLMVIVVAELSGSTVTVSAITCSLTELSPCLAAFTSSAPVTSACCDKLRQQKPCLCVYAQNPSLRPYVNTPGARKVASNCGIAFPKC